MTELDLKDSKRIPLVDIFGPTIQGEGQLIGRPTWFVRLGGCDYKCFFCDTDYAVDPRTMKERGTPRMTAEQIAQKFLRLAERSSVRLVTLSGGNPAIWNMGPFVLAMRKAGFKIAVETQGSIYHDWIAHCDYVTISPKGPGMTTENSFEDVSLFLTRLGESHVGHLWGVCLKIPILIKDDLLFAERIKVLGDIHGVPLYLQGGNRFIHPSWYDTPGRQSDDPATLTMLREELLTGLERISDMVMYEFPDLTGCPILPQMHVLLFGNAERK